MKIIIEPTREDEDISVLTERALDLVNNVGEDVLIRYKGENMRVSFYNTCEDIIELFDSYGRDVKNERVITHINKKLKYSND